MDNELARGGTDAKHNKGSQNKKTNSMHYTLVATYVPQSWKKTYKIVLAKLWVWKISTHNMCKKGSKSCKNAKKRTQKMQLFLTTWKIHELAQHRKIRPPPTSPVTREFEPNTIVWYFRNEGQSWSGSFAVSLDSPGPAVISSYMQPVWYFGLFGSLGST